MNKKVKVSLYWIGSLIVLWELISFVLIHIIQDDIAHSKLPFLHDVVLTMIDQFDLLFAESVVTLSNSALGFILGALIGILLAIWMSLSRTLEGITFPYLIFLQMIPVLGLAPIIYGIVRDEYVARILISAYITFFPVAIGMLSGMRSVKQDQRDLMFSYAVSKRQLYTKLLFPAALPNLFSSLKVTAPLSVTAAILVELMGAQRGIGVLMLRNLYYGAPQVVSFWATVLVSALLGIISFQLITLLEYLFLPSKQIAAEAEGDR